MFQSEHTTRLAGQLQMLKTRTDRSYEALSRRIGVSRSALHRYCRGEVVPALDVIVRFGKVCGATQGEAEELLRYWALAVDGGHRAPVPPRVWRRWVVPVAVVVAAVCGAGLRGAWTRAGR